VFRRSLSATQCIRSNNHSASRSLFDYLRRAPRVRRIIDSGEISNSPHTSTSSNEEVKISISHVHGFAYHLMPVGKSKFTLTRAIHCGSPSERFSR
jgi:hypothetical protein